MPDGAALTLPSDGVPQVATVGPLRLRRRGDPAAGLSCAVPGCGRRLREADLYGARFLTAQEAADLAWPDTRDFDLVCTEVDLDPDWARARRADMRAGGSSMTLFMTGGRVAT